MSRSISLSALISGGLVFYASSVWVGTTKLVVDRFFPKADESWLQSIVVSLFITLVILLVILTLQKFGEYSDTVIETGGKYIDTGTELTRQRIVTGLKPVYKIGEQLVTLD